MNTILLVDAEAGPILDRRNRRKNKRIYHKFLTGEALLEPCILCSLKILPTLGTPCDDEGNDLSDLHKIERQIGRAHV